LLAEAIGRDKTEQIYYRVLDGRYISTQANFVDMRLAVGRAAADLYGENGAETQAAAAAFDAVGVLEGEPPTALPIDRVPLIGEEWIAVVNAEPNDNSLVLAQPEITSVDDIVRLTRTQVFTRTNNPISISADGAKIFFIDANNFIRSIRPDGSQEQVVSPRGIWASIALSPDGRRLAATTAFRDSTLFVFDLEDPDLSKAIRLYNPTTQRDVRSYVTRFADALDWDHEGKSVLFDAFNTVDADSGRTFEFWRINMLNVENELIMPVFPAQPPGINIGNPSFAQTNDHFFTFERVDFDAGTSEIWAANLFTGATALIEPNGDSIGHPRYSPDDRELVFQRLEGGVQTLRRIRLRDDKINAASASTAYASEAQLPLWFTIGEEAQSEVPTSIEDQFELPNGFALYPNAPNPFNPATLVRFSLPRAGQARLVVYNLLGQQVSVLAAGLQAAGEHVLRWDGRDVQGRPAASGVYLYRLETLDEGGQPMVLTQKMTLLR
jgi:dipeptidyl aminopeptidase/acylaminoacyl peptidase